MRNSMKWVVEEWCALIEKTSYRCKEGTGYFCGTYEFFGANSSLKNKKFNKPTVDVKIDL